MRTSYYAITPHDTPGAIAISRSVPKNTRYLCYPALAPSSNLLREYKAGLVDQKGYRQIYWRETLEPLDPLVVWNALHHLANGAEPILLCYEGAGKFCHRRIVAEWLRALLDVEVPEGFPSGQLQLF